MKITIETIDGIVTRETKNSGVHLGDVLYELECVLKGLGFALGGVLAIVDSEGCVGISSEDMTGEEAE